MVSWSPYASLSSFAHLQSAKQQDGSITKHDERVENIQGDSFRVPIDAEKRTKSKYNQDRNCQKEQPADDLRQ